MNRAQPTSRASGVSCTPWLDGMGHGTTAPIRPARHAVGGTRGHGTRGHAPPWSGITGHGTRGHAPPLTGTRPAQDSHAANGPLPNGPSSAGPQRAGHAPPSSAGPRRAAPQRAVIRAGTPRASVGSVACPSLLAHQQRGEAA